MSDVDAHVRYAEPPRLVGDEVDELFGGLMKKEPAAMLGDGIFEEGAGFHVEESAARMAFVALSSTEMLGSLPLRAAEAAEGRTPCPAYSSSRG